MCRAWYMARTSAPNDPGPSRPDTCTGKPPPGERPEALPVPGQLAALADPASYTAAPNTCPTGSKPAPRTTANSSEVSAESHARPLTPPA